MILGYKSNNNVVYSTKYHRVWCPKYGRRVLEGKIAKRCEQVIRKTGAKYRAEITPWLSSTSQEIPFILVFKPRFLSRRTHGSLVMVRDTAMETTMRIVLLVLVFIVGSPKKVVHYPATFNA